MKKKEQKNKVSSLNLIEKAKLVNQSVENGEKVMKFVKRIVIPAAVIGFAVLAYAVFDVDISDQAKK
ncbi:MAG: hypothetical protein IKR59_05175 [Lachnospiraceae bacterium]|nr:hypothetical protein [Lachnospiraceae bacterium]